MVRIGSSDLDVLPLVLGGNVFGWTADEVSSYAVLDRFVEAGIGMVDTADAYSAWAPGNRGGESEEVLGRWIASRGARDRIVLATKVAKHPQRPGLSAANIRAACEDSLRRLQTDVIDLYYAHADDPAVPVEETLGGFDALVREGKVRYVAASNFPAERLAESLAASDRDGLARYIALQQHYNLVHRKEYEGPLRDVVAVNGLASLPYYGLASGFLTGKYRPGTSPTSDRATRPGRYSELMKGASAPDGGSRVLDGLDQVAGGRPLATIALAWLLAQPTVTAPIASARTVEQLPDLLAAMTTVLTVDELAALDDASLTG